MQNDYECFYMLADLHAITVSVNPDELRENILNTAATFLACGLDEKKYYFLPITSSSAF